MKYLKERGINILINGESIMGLVTGTPEDWSFASITDRFIEEVPAGVLHSTLTNDPDSSKFQNELADLITKQVEKLLAD